MHTLTTLLVNPVRAFASVSDWQTAATDQNVGVVLYRLRGRMSDEPQRIALKALSEHASGAPIVLVCSSEDPDEIAEAFRSGVRGYIPTNIPVEVAVQAARLVMAGGTFFPAGSLLASRAASHAQAAEDRAKVELFTPRQSLVVQALCRGKPNKVIAYELNMCESTVKVHVRNIMKKLNVKNRTEVVVAVNAIAKDAAA